MANPQKEDGYTAIANEIMDALIAAQLSGQQLAIALLVIRKTYGFQKKSDAISLSQMAAAIGSSRIRCSQVVNQLVLMKILTVNENINGILKSYSFNKDFDKWDTVNENINRKGFAKGTVNVLRNPPLMKTLTTKETITKETITKEIKPIVCYTPDFETFWKSYPRKIGKDKAWTAWKKRNGTRPPVDVIVKAVEIQKKCSQWIRDGGQYIPHPATWINGGRWMDEPDEHPLTGKMSDKTIETVEMLKDWRPPL